ncbi:hypothetical protein BO71DRAFT_145909 [Aspergillus ellipticus CBS 707.79]|uniref:Uncharacterized protein n=1 Tax=Aspergillus ellipticus CBS 707.79 TaxID=1448320 RepID=A0A319DHZ9_9EURO|nr:hypothetical protein BO71DRAFT_145909 [Aspergillus ellipticus CBS 707.79]
MGQNRPCIEKPAGLNIPGLDMVEEWRRIGWSSIDSRRRRECWDPSTDPIAATPICGPAKDRTMLVMSLARRLRSQVLGFVSGSAFIATQVEADTRLWDWPFGMLHNG